MTEELQTIEVGPIWNNDHAIQVANDWIAKNPGYVWRGDWRSTVPGVMSVIDVFKVDSKQSESLASVSVTTNL